MRTYNKMRYKRLRMELIESLGSRCSKCYSTENLELDHKDSTTKNYDISKRMLWGYFTNLDEIHKLQLLCRTCHKAKSILDRGFTASKGSKNHGTLSSYRYCKCPACVAAKQIYNKFHKKISQSVILALFPCDTIIGN